MISQTKAKLLHSLQNKKIRQKLELFLVEGAKNIREMLAASWPVEQLFLTEDFADVLYAEGLLSAQHPQPVICDAEELERHGTLQVHDAGIAIAVAKTFNTSEAEGPWYLALDQVRDPGNLGTIIRVADWYGISTILAQPGTAELYNPKVIAATMGSFTRVKVIYTDLAAFLPSLQLPIYGTLLEGASLHDSRLPSSGIMVLGNESHGLSPALKAVLTDALTIPRFGGAESLNVAIATAVVCDAIRRG